MNGRVYDPQLGRFLSVDPVFQFPTNTQSLNPYSYVLNNPLSLTDPTGYSADHNSTPAKPCPQGTASCSGVDAFSGSTELKASISADAIENIQKGANGGLIINLKDGSSFQVDSVSFDVTKDGNTTHVDENFGDSHGHGAGVTITGNGNNASQGVSNVNQSQTAADATMPAQQQKQTGSNPQNAGTTPPDSTWVNPTGGAVRGCDNTYGCGNWGASRDEGSKKPHKGEDFLSDAGQPVKAVTDGKVVRFGYPYGDTKKLTLIIIRTADGTEVRELYVNPTDTVMKGENVKAGQVIGTAQDLGSKFPGIPNHVHVDIKQNGVYIDPSEKIPEPQGQID